MLEYSEEVLDQLKKYMVGEQPNDIYLYKGKFVVFYGNGGKYNYTDAYAAFDSRTGEELNFNLFENRDFPVEAEKIA